MMTTQNNNQMSQPILFNLEGLINNNKTKSIPQRKLNYAIKLKEELLDFYDCCLIININNIGSKQIQEIRRELYGKARFIFGKNTLIRKILRDYIKQTGNKKLVKLMNIIKGNCGLVFCQENDIEEIKNSLTTKSKPCSAKTGQIAPNDVFIRKGNTGLQPTETSFIQSLGNNISSRINRGQIYIENDIHLIKKGNNIGASEVLLLSKLNIKPFIYKIKIESIYKNGIIEEINDIQYENEPYNYNQQNNDDNDNDTDTDTDTDNDTDDANYNPFDTDDSDTDSSSDEESN